MTGYQLSNCFRTILAVKVSFLLVLLLAITQASAATATVSIGNLSSAPGETVTAPVLISNVEDYGTSTINISYDPAVVHVTGVSSGPDSTVVEWNPDNTTGIVIISALNTGGVTGDIIFANVTFHAVRSAGCTPLNISVTTLQNIHYVDIPAIIKNGSFTIEAEQPLIPFLISGHVFHENGSECNNPEVKITNLNTSGEWQAETHADYNYYQILLDTGAGINTNAVLQFNATSPDGSQSKVFNHTVTSEDINKGGLFNFNITFGAPPAPEVVINEFLPAPDVNQTSEWIELHNKGNSDVSLDNWTIEDNTGSTYGSGSGDTALDSYTVPANGYLVLDKSAGDFDFGLNNGNDIIILKYAGNVVDKVAYGSFDDGDVSDNAPYPGTDKSTGRFPNGVDTDNDKADFKVFDVPTEGAQNAINDTAPPTVVSIGNASTNTGYTTLTPITIDNATNLGSIDINLTYNSSVVIAVNVTCGDFDVTIPNLEHNLSGLVRIVAFQTENPGLNGSVNLAWIRLKAVGNTGETSPLNISVNTLKDATPQCNPVPYQASNGTFTVLLNGDVNGDGEVDISDAMYLAKHVLGITGFEPIIEEAADVNGDGMIDISDAMYLAKHVLGIEGFEELK